MTLNSDQKVMLSEVASAPAAISFIFKPVLPEKNITNMTLIKRVNFLSAFGSIGIGATVKNKVKVKVSQSRAPEIYFNGVKSDLPTVTLVLKILKRENIKADITSLLPLAFGFGISGASSLATASAVNKLCNLKLDNIELARIAHAAEIMAKTGLGTVATQISGGFLIKDKAGLPPKFKRIKVIQKYIYAYLLGTMSTDKILKNKRQLIVISREADKALSEVKKLKKVTLANLLDISYKYCLNSSLVTDARIKELIEQIRRVRGHGTQAVLGNVVFSDIKIKSPYPVYKLRIQ